MRGLRPGWRTGILAARAIGDLSKLETDYLAVNTGQISLDLIKRSNAEGKLLYAWTVDDPVTMSRMISMGVDGLITNQPALARQVMERRNALATPERLLLWVPTASGSAAFGWSPTKMTPENLLRIGRTVWNGFVSRIFVPVFGARTSFARPSQRKRIVGTLSIPLARRPSFNRLGQALRRRAERDRLLERVQRGGAGNRLIDGGLIAIDDRRGS